MADVTVGAAERGVDEGDEAAGARSGLERDATAVDGGGDDRWRSARAPIARAMPASATRSLRRMADQVFDERGAERVGAGRSSGSGVVVKLTMLDIGP